MKNPIALLSCVLLLACVGTTEDDADREAESFMSALSKGAGAGPAVWEDDPCRAPAAYAKAHGYHLIVAAPNQHEIHGTAKRDLIVGTDGDDEIWGHEGDDVICAGYGEDIVHGNDGSDYIDGGGDNDQLFGDGDGDVIHGRGGGDHIFGGPGDDLLFGDILDDHLFGEEGDDLLIGGHGTDVMMGGPGNDYLRGDTGNDAFIGGDGNDVASFATAMPPGQPELATKPKNPITGVKVDFTDDCANTGFAASDVGGKSHHDGCANGDSGNEPLDGIEIVVGSPYADVFVSGGRKIVGGYGDDKCDGAPCGSSGSAGGVLVAIDPAPRDSGLVVMGTSGDDAIEIVAVGHVLRVRSSKGPLVAGHACRLVGAEIECSIGSTIRWIAASMDDGNDVVRLGVSASFATAFPRDLTAHVTGGNGDDTLIGGDEEDVLFSGPTGEDRLYGHDGDDALLSESRKWPTACPTCLEQKPKAAAYTDGGDELFGGPGDDQLVADYPCGHHLYSGGGGKDVAGFARSGRFGITAQLAGAASVVKDFHGIAFNPALCGKESGTRFADDDLEILEAADGDDELWGNDRANIVWGREGNDRIHGLAGDDLLQGLVGEDWVFGGAGNDRLQGEHLFPDAD